MNVNALARKLGVREGHRMMILGAPAGYIKSLGELPDAVSIADRPGKTPADFAQLFVRNREELEQEAPRALRGLRRDGIFWICYPKKSSGIASDLSRDRGWEILDQEGLRPVSQISIDAVWSALRFRPKERVGASASRQ